MTINGFEIDKYNIYDIKEGVTASTCPMCSHNRKKSSEKCMSVFWDTGIGNCNHCGERIQLHTYKSKVELKKYIVPDEKPFIKRSKEVDDYFLKTRGISESTLNHLKISSGVEFMPKAQKKIEVIEFNYYLHGKLVNTKFRGKGKDFKFIKDAKQILYNIDSIIGEKVCTIVEGEIDVCSFVEAGIYSVISVPNGFTLPRKDGTSTITMEYLEDFIPLLDSCEEIILAVDKDPAGDEGKKELLRRLGFNKCKIVDFGDCKDANEFLIKKGKEELRKAHQEAKPVPIPNIKTIADTWESLKDFWRNGDKSGYKVGLREMDKNCSFAFSQYTLLLSAANSGKSEKLDDIVIRLNLRYGLKAAFCSPENETKLHHHKWMLKLYGKTPVGAEIDSQSLFDVAQYVDENFFSVVDTGDIVTVLDRFRQLYRRNGVKIFVIDPFNRIRLKGTSRSDVNEYTELYHAELDKFVKETDSHLFLALHPIKVKASSDGKTYPIPSAYDSKGGGEHFDMSYNILGMSRNFDTGVVDFRNLKWKYGHLGTVGAEWSEAWNTNNGRYSNLAIGFKPAYGEQVQADWDNKCWLSYENEEINFTVPTPEESINLFESGSKADF